jgi:putative transposase
LQEVLAKIPAGMQAEIRDGYWEIFDTDGLKTTSGPRLVELIDHRLTEFADRYAATYSAAMRSLLTDRAGPRPPALSGRTPPRAHLRRNPPPRQGHRPLPRRNLLHHHRVGRLGPGLPRLWRGLPMTADGLRLLQDLRRSLLEPRRQLRLPTAAASQDGSGGRDVGAVA